MQSRARDAAAKQLLSLSDPFEILGVSPEDNDEAVRAAFLTRVRCFTPEREPRAYQHLRAAYDALRSAGRRRELRLCDRRPPAVAPLVQALTDVLTQQPQPLDRDDLRRLFAIDPANQ